MQIARFVASKVNEKNATRCTYRLMSEGRFFHTYNVVTIVAWAGVGKSTLVNRWLRRMAAENYRSAELVFGWSFYRQGSSAETSSADDFLVNQIAKRTRLL